MGLLLQYLSFGSGEYVSQKHQEYHRLGYGSNYSGLRNGFSRAISEPHGGCGPLVCVRFKGKGSCIRRSGS